VLKEMYNNIRFGLQSYIWQPKTHKDEDQNAKYMATRVAVGILLEVLMDQFEQPENKSKESDYALFSKLVLSHAVPR
jgi:hypothetical protein